MLLQALYDNIHFKDRVLTRKRVTLVNTFEGYVHVETEDGSKYTGDIVVGADGVHSAVRKEMQRNILEFGPGRFEADKDDGSSSRARNPSSKITTDPLHCFHRARIRFKMHLRHIQTAQVTSYYCFTDQRIFRRPELHDALGATRPPLLVSIQGHGKGHWERHS